MDTVGNGSDYMSIDDVDEYAKPILRPLSDLTEKELYDEGFDSHVDYCTWEQTGKPIERLWKAPYEMIEYLISQHYDVFNLIPLNLAIDKNTINS